MLASRVWRRVKVSMPQSKQEPKPSSNQSSDQQSDQQSNTQSPRVHKFLTEDLTVRISVVNATKVVDEMRSIQNSYPLATVAVGRSMVAALLMASHLKDGQELSLYFQGNGPLGRVFAEANFEGQVRGYCNHPQFQAPIEGEQITIGAAIGIGILTVTHHLPGNDEPHRGTVIIRTGEVGDDIAFYLHQSHQIPSVVSLGVHLNPYGLVDGAGGILIELMPGHSDETISLIEENVKKARSVSTMITEGAQPLDIVREFLGE
ncbi:MAG: Hsp33 family molecular chaperone HslO, partial [Proteobacteria bacterium]